MCVVQLPVIKNILVDFSTEDIICIESDGHISVMHYETYGEKKKIYINKMIGEVEALLNGHGFYRCHKKALINMNKVKPYGQYPKEAIVLEQNIMVPLSRRKKLEFHNMCLEILKTRK